MAISLLADIEAEECYGNIFSENFDKNHCTNCRNSSRNFLTSEFTQPEKRQVCFCPMGKYTATPFTSHIRIPFNYSSLMDLQYKLDAQLNDFFHDLQKFHFNMDQSTLATLKSTFKIYKQSTAEIFKLFHDILASLPHVHAQHRHQWDIASFVAASAALSLPMYNIIQISKLETAIEAQQAKTDLLMDISKLHEQHLHKLDGNIDAIGKELQVVRLQLTFQVRVDRIIAQITSDESKLRAVISTFERIIIMTLNKKLAPGALSTDVLNSIIYHINDIANKNNYNKFVHEPANL